MGKDPRTNAEKELNKAELYYDGKQYKKAGKLFKSVGDSFFKLKEFKIAQECYSYAAKSYDFEERPDLTIDNLKYAADSSLLIRDFSTSNKFFKGTIRHIPNLRKQENRNFYYIFFSSLSYFCQFLEGKQDQALEFIKEIKKDVDGDYFKESPFISIIKNLTIAIRDRNSNYLDKIEKDFNIYNLNEAETILLKRVLAVAKAQIMLITTYNLDKEKYTTRDLITLTINVDTKPIIDISNYAFFNYNFKEITISNISLNVSDNITAQKKPKFPIALKAGENYDFHFVLKPHFQLEEPFIGPIVFTCEFDNKFVAYREDKDKIKPNIISPPPSLEISMKNLRPPLIGQSFPMEFLIENKSDGDALELSIELEFPEQLKVMRGTLKKQIYSLASNETINWELNLKPTEPGDYKINMDIKFKDPDQNLIEEAREFPFAIKM